MALEWETLHCHPLVSGLYYNYYGYYYYYYYNDYKTTQTEDIKGPQRSKPETDSSFHHLRDPPELHHAATQLII